MLLLRMAALVPMPMLPVPVPVPVVVAVIVVVAAVVVATISSEPPPGGKDAVLVVLPGSPQACLAQLCQQGAVQS